MRALPCHIELRHWLVGAQPAPSDFVLESRLLTDSLSQPSTATCEIRVALPSR